MRLPKELATRRPRAGYTLAPARRLLGADCATAHRPCREASTSGQAAGTCGSGESSQHVRGSWAAGRRCWRGEQGQLSQRGRGPPTHIGTRMHTHTTYGPLRPMRTQLQTRTRRHAQAALHRVTGALHTRKNANVSNNSHHQNTPRNTPGRVTPRYGCVTFTFPYHIVHPCRRVAALSRTRRRRVAPCPRRWRVAPS